MVSSVWVILIWVSFMIGLVACQNKPAAEADADRQEDTKAKQMLQGVWINADSEDPAIRVQGDTIFYPDSTSIPVRFQIFGDTLVLHGASDVRYAIVKQMPHVFEFRNQNGDIIRLVKSDDEEEMMEFEKSEPAAINQNRLIKRDTIFNVDGRRYHCYVQVNPTTYKVIKTTYNDEGVQVGNVYYDNIINLAVFQGAQRVFSSDFHKNDFAKHVPADFLKNSILSDMVFSHVDAEGIHYTALICEPDSPSSYAVDVLVAFNGKVTFNKKAEER
ncbi:MAG: DUF4738 domain-containing protein [Prevotella sp.]|nr:DUF4738 domain-containing protein [Prevotella sp.]